MRTAPSATCVRRLVVEQFRKYGASGVDETRLQESILVSEGRYRGRSYRIGSLTAMWFVELELVQFYAADGTLLGTFSLSDHPTPSKHKAAA